METLYRLSYRSNYGSLGGTRTPDRSVNSRLLYQLSYQGILEDLAPSKLDTQHLLHKDMLWISPRPISIRQLHVLPRFHTEPINLIVYKGSYQLALWEVSSWRGLHA